MLADTWHVCGIFFGSAESIGVPSPSWPASGNLDDPEPVTLAHHIAKQATASECRGSQVKVTGYLSADLLTSNTTLPMCYWPGLHWCAGRHGERPGQVEARGCVVEPEEDPDAEEASDRGRR